MDSIPVVPGSHAVLIGAALISFSISCEGNENASSESTGDRHADARAAADSAAGESQDRADTDVGDAARGDTAQTTTEKVDAGGPISAEVIHQLDDYELEPGEEKIPCVQWTLHNEKPLYVNSVTLANEGGFHHSNWYVVPEDYVPGEDGYFDCDERGYRGFTAALEGTVLFAQSTQAQSEVQSFPDGVVTKIPPNHKIVADLHFLNISPRKRTTSARLTLGLTHPRDVETVATPFVLSYRDLQIPPESEARFTSSCDFTSAFRNITGEEFNAELFYILPHYHGLGNYFELEIAGGPRDGEQLFELHGFNAEANGQTFSPPVDLTDAEGLRFTCGYDNPRDESVGWGIGGQEMCMMLGFSDADAVIAGRVPRGNEVVENDGEIVYNEGPCEATAVPRSDAQKMPTEEERQGEMYVPESDGDEELDPIPECEEYPGTAEPLREPTLSNLQTDLFRVGCAFSSCHDSESPAAGLELAADDLHDELMNHELLTPTDYPLVDPGNPEGSWLYRVTSNCEPETNEGTTSHMPRNSPTLLEPEILAMIREWIARGAQDN